MGRKSQNPHRELLRPEEKLLGVCLLVISKGEKLGGDPDRLPSVLSLKDGPSGKSGIEPGIGLFPPNRPVTEYLGGNLPEPGGVLSDEACVLLVDRNGRSRKGDRFLGEDPVIPVLRDLRVVDETLVSNPLEKNRLLGGSGIRAKAVAGLHGSMIPSVTWIINPTDQAPMPYTLLRCTLFL